MKTRRMIACTALAGVLSASVPAAEAAPPSRLEHSIGRGAAHGAENAVVISLGAAAGVALLVGGSLWYWFHHRRESTERHEAEDPARPE